MTDPVSRLMYLAPPFVTLLVNLVLIFIVWRASRKSASSRLFIGFLGSMALWCFVLLGMRSSPDLLRALWWERAIPVTTYASFVLFYHFTITYSNFPKGRIPLRIAYLFLILIIVLSPTSLVVEDMRLESYGYAPNIGSVSYPLFLGYILLITGGVFNLLRAFKRSVYSEERNRLVYIILGAIFLIIGMFLDAFSNLPPMAVWTNLLFCIIATFAIVKYHLLDIRLIAKKSLEYLIVSAIAAIPFAIIIVLVSKVITPGPESWLWYLVLIIILAVLMRPAYGWAQNLVDRFYFRNRYDYFKALEDFSQESHKLNDVNQIGYSLVRLIKRALHSSSSYLLLPENSGRFEVVSATEEKTFRLSLSGESSLMRWLRDNKTILHRQDLHVIPQLQSFASTGLEELGGIKAELFVPILTKEQDVIGLIILGEKLSQQLYSQEDERLLLTVANRMAIELDNARLYGEIRRSSARLRESEEKIRRVFESMSDAIVVTDLKGNILDCNDQACRFVRCASKNMILNKNLSDFITPFQYEKMRAEIKKILKGGVVSNSEGTARRLDGTEFPIETGASMLRDDTGAPIGFVVIVRDITKRRQSEMKTKELEQKANIASRLASVGEMSAGIAHEINNPLTSVIGFSELLLQQDIPAEVRKKVEIINTGAQRVSGVIRRLLTFSRQQKPERGMVDINDILRTTFELRTYHMNATNIKVKLDLDSSLPQIAADGGQLQQVFLNIILNAETEMRLAHSGGNLRVKTETINGFIRIAFSDDGRGITEENMKRLFDPFFTTREVGEGTGLGLSICHGIITEHKGRIYAENRESGGATFTVELPITTLPK